VRDAVPFPGWEKRQAMHPRALLVVVVLIPFAVLVSLEASAATIYAVPPTGSGNGGGVSWSYAPASMPSFSGAEDILLIKLDLTTVMAGGVEDIKIRMSCETAAGCGQVCSQICLY
jgi:hypothetical protein